MAEQAVSAEHERLCPEHHTVLIRAIEREITGDFGVLRLDVGICARCQFTRVKWTDAGVTHVRGGYPADV